MSARASAPGPAPAPRPVGQPLRGTLRPAAIALVVVGGTFGSLARYLVDVALDGFALGDVAIGGVAFAPLSGVPVPTLVVNLVGAFVLGVVFEALAAPSSPARVRVRLALGTGFIGAFTTYSALAVELAQLFSSGRTAGALAYAVITLVVGGALSFAGIALGAALRHRRERRHIIAADPVDRSGDVDA